MSAKRTDVVVLAMIAIISGIMLSGTFTSTEEDILAAKEAYKQEGLRKVMPFMKDTYEEKSVSFKNKDTIIYTIQDAGVFKGAALRLVTNQGYSGRIVFLLGLDAESKITGLFVLEHAETPGLGAKSTSEKWWGQFVGKSKPEYKFKVKKDGGDIDAITASTITSRAITNAVDEGLDIYKYFLSLGEDTFTEK